MTNLTDQNLLPLFCELMEQVVNKGSLGKPFIELSQKELGSLSEEVNKAKLPEGGISYGALRDYQMMCKGNRKNPLTVSYAKLALLCRYADFTISLFYNQSFVKKEHEVTLLITRDFFEEHNSHIAKRLRRRYASLTEAHEIANLKIKIHEGESPNNESEARQLAFEKNADFLVWGETIPPGGMNYKLLLTGPQNYGMDRLSSRHIQKNQALTSLADLCEGDQLMEPEYLIFFVLGYIAYQQKEDDNALEYWRKVVELNEQVGDGHFYLGTLHQLKNEYVVAESHYEKALSLELLGTDIVSKIRINYALLLTQSNTKKNYLKAIQLLTEVKEGSEVYSKNKYALLFQFHLWLGDSEKAYQSLENWGNQDIIGYHKKFGSLSREVNMEVLLQDTERFLVIKGNRSILVQPEGLPALENLTILSRHSKVISSVKESELVLISLSTFVVFKLRATQKSAPVDSLLTRFEEYEMVRNGFPNKHSKSHHWIILNPTKIKLKAYDQKPDDQIVLQFVYKGEIVNNALKVENGAILLTEESILRDNQGSPIHFPHELKEIKIIAYNEHSERSPILYHVPGFAFMTPSYLKEVVSRFRSLLPGLPPFVGKKKTQEFVYQSYGIIPELYLEVDQMR